MSLTFDRTTWPTFYALLRFNAQAQGLWAQIDPDAVSNESEPLNGPLAPPPTLESIVEEENKRRADTYEATYALWEASNASEAERGPPPDAPTLATARDKALKDRFEESRKDYPSRVAHQTYRSKGFNTLNQWIEAHVQKELLVAAMQIAGQQNEQSTRALVKTLRDLVAPTYASTITTIRDEYQNTLREAKRQGTGIDAWIQRFQVAFLNAKAYQLHDVLEEPKASLDFLYAVGTRIQTTWARGQVDEITKNDALGQPQTLQLNDYVKWFVALASANASREHSFDVYATLGGRSRGRNEPWGGDCPCGDQHPWEPKRCLYVEYALNGDIKEDYSGGRFSPPSEVRQKEILARLKTPKWNSVHAALAQRKGMEKRLPTGTFPGSVTS